MSRSKMVLTAAMMAFSMGLVVGFLKSRQRGQVLCAAERLQKRPDILTAHSRRLQASRARVRHRGGGHRDKLHH